MRILRAAGVLVAALLAAGSLAGQLTLPPGYTTTTFYEDASSAPFTGLARDDQGRVLLVDYTGTVEVLEDLNGDLVAETVTTYWAGAGITPPATGILWHQDRLLIAHMGTISEIPDTDSNLVGDGINHLVTGLPTGMHQNNALFTDGTWVYFGVGSETDHGTSADPRYATLMRMQPDGSQTGIFATGLRNVFDGAVHPATGEIFAGDNGPNSVVGNPDPPDELVRIQANADYGHPANWGFPPPGAGSAPPVLELPAHASPTGIAFNPGTALSGYRDELYVCAFGPSLIGALLRVPVVHGSQTGLPAGFWEMFAFGLENPIDLLFDDSGNLLVAEFTGLRVRAIHPTSSAVITIEGQSSVGMTTALTFRDPSHPLHVVVGAASTGLGAPVALGPGLDMHLDPFSPIFQLSLTAGNGVFFLPAPGMLDGSGLTGGGIVIPDDPSLAFLELQLQACVFDASGQAVAVSAPTALVVMPAF